MLSEQTPLFILMFFSGFGIPVMAAMNASLGRSLGSPLLAAAVLCMVASITAFILLFGTSPNLTHRSWPINIAYYSAGILFVFYIASITYSSPRIGLGNSIFLVLLGQIFCAALIDHFGWAGGTPSTITVRRIAGLTLMVAGVYFAKSDVLV